MHSQEYDFQILKLTDAFYNAYPNPPYVEILKKKERAYNCLLFDTNYDYFICIPFRTEVKHSCAYHFQKSKRSKAHRSGLDYKKTVIVSKTEYIDSQDALIDKDEYNETVLNIKRIKAEALQYVEDYVAHVNGTQPLHQTQYNRRYRFSSLPYFHKELGLEE